MDSVSAWLGQLGLGQYEETFKIHAFDLRAVAGLTDADLNDLGVTVPDHRKRLLEEIEAVRVDANILHGSAPERRHLTVMFCDLVSSTELSARLDPEELASLIGSYQDCCAEVVARFKGKVARYIGDGVLAYFGHPKSYEDSAERSIHAALAIAGNVGNLDRFVGTPLQVRVGIATGSVVVGNLPGSRAVERDAVVGDTPNLAARLQNVAEPNGVVISANTYRLAGHLFECKALEPITVKGFVAPVKAWAILGERAFLGRFNVRRAAGLITHFGRVTELNKLIDSWDLAKNGAGRLIVIKGEAGIGKSRLVQELTDRISNDSYQQIDFAGSPFLQNSPLSPVIAQLQRAAGLLHSDSPARKREKLDVMLGAEGSMNCATKSIIASLLSMPSGPHDPPSDPDPQRRKRNVLDTIIRRITDLSVREPVLLVCEDAHWFDHTTLELLDILVKQIATRAVLMIVTSRPDFMPMWEDENHVSELVLDRLERSVAVAMVKELSSGKPDLSADLLLRIVERTDGVPLFIEELTKSVLQENRDGAARGTESHVAIPDTLRDLLIARLDSAPQAREVAQVGSAIGREFSQALLEEVTSIGNSVLLRMLDQLVDSNLLHRSVSGLGIMYVFKHALLQDAAYETLLFARRKVIHRRIAQALEIRYPEICNSQPELLALHWERADVVETAITYWKQAATLAASRSGDFEADVHLRRALKLIDRMPEDRSRNCLELDVRVQHGGVLRVTQGPPAAETGKAFARARDLCHATENHRLLVPALSGLYAYHLVRAENDLAADAAKQLLTLAESCQDRQFLMIGHRTVGMVMVHTGKLEAARKHLEQSLALYNDATDGQLAYLYGTDHAQTAAGWLAKALWLLGMPDSAGARESWAMAHATRVNHLFSLVQIKMFRVTVRLFARDWEAVAAQAQEIMDIATRHSLRYALNFSGFCLAACQAVRHPDQKAAKEMRVAADAWGTLNYRPLYLGLIAEAQANAGDPDAGLQTLAEAQSVVESTDERWVEPELHRLTGQLELLRATSSINMAEVSFRKAIVLAKRQGSRSLELRASISLARMLEDCSRGSEIRDLLAAVYDGFTEGFNTPDLIEARSLLGKH